MTIASVLDELIGDNDPFNLFSFEYQSILLDTGETVLCQIADVSETYYLMMLPLKIITIQRGEQISHRLGLLNISSDEWFYLINKSRVVTAGSMSQEFYEVYNEVTEGIVNALSEEEILTKLEEKEKDDNIVEFKKPTMH